MSTVVLNGAGPVKVGLSTTRPKGKVTVFVNGKFKTVDLSNKTEVRFAA